MVWKRSMRWNNVNRSFSVSYFPAFEQNTEKYSASLCIQSECRKIRTKKTPNTSTFHPVLIPVVRWSPQIYCHLSVVSCMHLLIFVLVVDYYVET